MPVDFDEAADLAAALAYVILGAADEAAGTARSLLSFSGALPSLKPAFYADLAQLQPMPDADGALQPALALLHFDDERLLLIHCQPKRDASGLTEHHVFLPLDAAPQAAVISDWLRRLPPPPSDIDMTVMTMPLPAINPPSANMRGQSLDWLLSQFAADNLDSALSLLHLLMDGGMRIANFPTDFSRRLSLVAGLQALLPGSLAARLSYATHAPLTCQRPLQLAFVDDDAADESDLLDWQARDSLEAAPSQPYLDLLRGFWDGDAAALAKEILRLDTLVARPDADLPDALDALVSRHELDRQVASGDGEVETQALLEAVDGGAPTYGETRRQYFLRLLHNALNERDAAAGRRVAEEMQRDAQLQSRLLGALDSALEDQPDAVYVFIRNRLRQLGIDAGWIARLDTAARSSLEVAIQDGDGGTLARWLEHIAHEPQAYALDSALREGILSARLRAYADGELGKRLILIAARRSPELVAVLLGDVALIGALDNQTRLALQSPTADNLQGLTDGGAEIWLLALRRGLDSAGEAQVTLELARRLWALADSGERVNLPADYQPQALVTRLMTADSPLLREEALDFLFGRLIAGDDGELIADCLQRLSERGMLFPRLTQTLERVSPPPAQAQAIMQTASALPDAPPNALIDAYFSLLDHYHWEPQAQRLMVALARLLAKHQDAKAPDRHLWKLYESCQALELEVGCRVAVVHLLREYGEAEEPPEVVQGLARVCRQTASSKTLQELVDAWWRDYAQSLALPQLQRLEREMASQRGLETQKQILKTALAMRRWLHSRSAEEFADAIDVAFTVVDQLVDAFDGEPPLEIDARAIRREVDALGGDLSSERRHILATNLRNLAQRITQMAEKRSKPSLIRSDDSIDRQLTRGEAQPHGSIDMMKWLAGYLDGAHAPDDD